MSARLEDACESLALMLVPDDPSDERDAIIEVGRRLAGAPPQGMRLADRVVLWPRDPCSDVNAELRGAGESGDRRGRGGALRRRSAEDVRALCVCTFLAPQHPATAIAHPAQPPRRRLAARPPPRLRAQQPP